MLPAAGKCSGCKARNRLLARLQHDNSQLQTDNDRLQRRQARLKADNRRLRQQLDEAQRQLDEARRQPHRQANPYRRRQRQTNPKPPGRPTGHPAAQRPTPTPDQVDRVIHVPCRHCPDCQTPLVDPHLVVQYQTDLPPVVPIITQFNIETGYCPCCQLYVQGRHPQQTSDGIGAAGNTLGPVVLTMAAELKHRLGVPYRKICDFLDTYCGLDIAPATLVRAEQRLAALAQPTYDLLIDALRRCDIVHADETGWRVSAVNAWLWVFSNQDLTIYTIRHSRGHEVPEDILGPDFDGVLIVDGLKSYEVLRYTKGQCNGHLLRRAKELQATAEPRDHDSLQTLITLIQEAIDLARRRQHLTPQGYARRVQEIDNGLAQWLEHVARRRQPSPELDRLASHVANHYDEWLLFLHEPQVPPTNNHAERMLRPAVISRKMGGCNKTLLGALVHSILGSLMVTCRQQGQKFLELARQLWRGREPQAIPLLPPPSAPAPAPT